MSMSMAQTCVTYVRTCTNRDKVLLPLCSGISAYDVYVSGTFGD